MKKFFKFFSIAALACGMMLATSCGGDEPNNPDNPDTPDVPGEPVLLEEAFESGIPSTWSNIDNDGDGYTWCAIESLAGQGVNGSNCVFSNSYDNSIGPLTPDNWLITPTFTIPSNGYNLKWQVSAQDAAYPSDHYAVVIGTVNNGEFTASAVLLEEDVTASKESGAWLQRSVNLDAYKGQTVAVAFRHYNCTDFYIMRLDEVKVTNE